MEIMHLGKKSTDEKSRFIIDSLRSVQYYLRSFILLCKANLRSTKKIKK